MTLFPMLYGYIIFVGLPRKCTIPIISFLNKIFFHFGSSYMPVRIKMFCNRKGWYAHPCKPFHSFFLDGPRRCIRRTIRDCSRCQSSRVVCRFGRSGSSGFVAGFRRLRWCGFDRRNRVRTYRTYPTSGLKVLCGAAVCYTSHILFFAKKIFSSVFLNKTISMSIFISISICFSIFKDFWISSPKSNDKILPFKS